MHRRVRSAAVLAASAVLAVAGCTSKTSSTSSPAGDAIVFTEGTSVHVAVFDGARLTVVDSASLPADGLLAGHSIFSLVKHPTKPWLFASSLNECATRWCWGNARIDRFTLDEGERSITWDARVYDFTVPDPRLFCTTADATRYEGQTGTCAPVSGMTGGVTVYGIDPAGAITTIVTLPTTGAARAVRVLKR